MFYMFFSSGKARQRERESERCETCALRCSLCGHEASSRQRDSAVLVSLMTAAEPDNDQEPASLFAGVHLLAESPRKEGFFYFLIVIFWVVFFSAAVVQNGSLGCWSAFISLLRKCRPTLRPQQSGRSWRTSTRKMYFPFSFNVTKASHFMDNNVLVVRSVVRRKWNEFNEREGRRHNPTPPPSTSASKTCSNTFCPVILETWWTSGPQVAPAAACNFHVSTTSPFIPAST